MIVVYLKNIMSDLMKTVLLICLMCFTLASCSNLDVQTLNNKAAKLMQEGDIDGAIARLESIQDLNPNFPQTNYNLGIAYKEKKDYDKSKQYLDRAISLKPDFYQAHMALSVVNEDLADKFIQMEYDKMIKTSTNSDASIDQIAFSADQTQKLGEYYKQAKLHLEDYLKYAPVAENKDALQAKISEYSEKIKMYSPASNPDTQNTVVPENKEE